MFVYWRLMLRRVVTVTDINPSIVAPKPVVVVVMLVVHANLRHHGIVHPLDECSVPISVYATAIASRLSVRAYRRQRWCSWAKAVPQERQTACMISNGSWLRRQYVNPAS
jgi:hypothetical protein